MFFQMWVNCLNFWTDVQEYHLLFYAEVIDPYIVQKKAKVGCQNVCKQWNVDYPKNMK